MTVIDRLFGDIWRQRRENIMSNTAIVVFTGRGIRQIIREGGSQAWRLDVARARGVEYLVCTQNYPEGDWALPEAPQGAGFLVGRISGLERSHEDNRRWHIPISEYAEISIPDLWDGGRYPVRYATLEDLGIDPTKLDWKPMPSEEGAPAQGASAHTNVDLVQHIRPLSIADAKKALSAYYAVDADHIEIVIRG